MFIELCPSNQDRYRCDLPAGLYLRATRYSYSDEKGHIKINSAQGFGK